MTASGRLIGLLLTALTTVVAVSSTAGEVEQFRALERDALRQAERRLPELFDRDTGDVLAEPSNDAERYVITRERRWFAEMHEQPRLKITDDGVVILEHSPASMATTWLVVDENGNALLRCISGDHDGDVHPSTRPAAETMVR